MATIKIVFEHKDFIVVNKPDDVPMHDPVEGICQRLKRQCEGQNFFLVHRLDTPTSGCLLLAKNPTAAAALSGLFEHRKIQKRYLALTDKKPKKKQGRISGDMQKSRQGSYKLTTSMTNPAVTFFKSESTQLANLNKSIRLFYLKPISGKTHQLRVALQSLGSSILGDTRYKGTPADRMYLHAYSLSFDYKGQSLTVTCWPQSGEFFEQLDFSTLRNDDQLAWPQYTSPNKTRH
jgi:tRNA pseudouridine32 synthase/23S rRNA pseudouridine746 synthase